MFGLTGVGPLLVFGTVIIVALLIFYVASRYRVANANEALIVAGSAGAKVRDEKGQLMTPAGEAEDEDRIREIELEHPAPLPRADSTGALNPYRTRLTGVPSPVPAARGGRREDRDRSR